MPCNAGTRQVYRVEQELCDFRGHLCCLSLVLHSQAEGLWPFFPVPGQRVCGCFFGLGSSGLEYSSRIQDAGCSLSPHSLSGRSRGMKTDFLQYKPLRSLCLCRSACIVPGFCKASGRASSTTLVPLPWASSASIESQTVYSLSDQVGWCECKEVRNYMRNQEPVHVCLQVVARCKKNIGKRTGRFLAKSTSSTARVPQVFEAARQHRTSSHPITHAPIH